MNKSTDEGENENVLLYERQRCLKMEMRSFSSSEIRKFSNYKRVKILIYHNLDNNDEGLE